MMIKRIFAGSIVALLLSVSSLAAACDLSCAMARSDLDCHSRKAPHQSSAHAGMKMDGMAMAGMSMQEAADGKDQRAASEISRTKSSHPSIGEMGPCARQTCDNNSAVSVKASRSVSPQLYSILAMTETPVTDIAPQLFHGARDDTAHDPPTDGSPLHPSLRI